MKIHWTPTPRQIIALKRLEDEILYGGARGGGKTDAGMVWLLYWIHIPKYRALIIRRNEKDLSDWVDRAREMYKPTGAVFAGRPVEIRFPSGSIFKTGHLNDAEAYTQYQGHEYQKMLIEELTHIPREDDYEKLLGSNRSTVDGIKAQTFATTNPDGDGHEWVKKRFKCEDEPETVIKTRDKETGLIKTKIFIPAKVQDNPHIMQKDPKYVAFLNSIKNPVLRKQWREGSWEDPFIEGAYYANELRQAKEENRITTVHYDKTLPVETIWDLGLGESEAMSIWFRQVVANEIRYIDYISGEHEGIPYYVKQLNDKEVRDYNYSKHYFPHDIEVQELSTGASRLETAEKLLGQHNCKVVDKLDVADGIHCVRMIFHKCWFDKVKCKKGLDALKNFKKEYDEKNACYKKTAVNNWAKHGADAFRYGAISYLSEYELYSGGGEGINTNYAKFIRRR